MRRILSFVFVVIASTTIASAQTPSTTRLIPYAGTAVDAAGSPLRGQVNIAFELYEQQEGGDPLWRETHRVQLDDRGRYLVYLGNITPMPQTAFTEERARWLAMTIDGRELPRVMLVAVPYALRAADADTLGGHPASSFVRSRSDSKAQGEAVRLAAPIITVGTPGQLAKYTSAADVGNSTITETSSNRIGIGTTDPTESGQLDSKVTIRGADGTTALAISNQVGIPRFALNINGDGSWITYDRGSGFFQPGIAQRGGRVGIATTDPTGGGVVDSKFTVRNLDNNTGIAVLNESNGRRFALNTLGTGAWVMYDGSGGNWNAGLSQRGGNVGIGIGTLFGTTQIPTSKLAVFIPSNAVTPPFNAVTGLSTVPNGIGVIGSGQRYGVQGIGAVDNSIGVRGEGFGSGSTGVSGTGVTGVIGSGALTGVYGTAGLHGVWGNSPDASGNGVYGTASGLAGVGVYGSGQWQGVFGTSTIGTGVVGSGGTYGVSGFSATGTGVHGTGDLVGVVGIGTGLTGSGVGVSASGGIGLQASGTHYAGTFAGDVSISGTLTKGGGSFKIDHPLDPANGYLSHSFVESPDMMNVYNGNVMLNDDGEAWVTLPGWFEALNRDFRYQLTAMGAPGPNLYVASEVSGNRFKIAGGTPNGRVSWQVTGIRQDAWANAHRIAVEENKPDAERGTYLHPKEHGQPEAGAATLSRTADRRQQLGINSNYKK